MPPACMPVRPAKTIITSLPKVSWFFLIPSPSPSPAATMMVMEIIPQAMPNIVSSVRRLWAHSVARVSRNRSVKFMALRRELLQNDLLFLVEAFEDFRLHAIRDPKLHAQFFLAVFSFGVGDFHGGLAVLVIDERRFGNHKHVFLFLEKDFGIGAHVGLEFAARIRNRNAYLKRRHIVFFFAQRRNLRHLAGKLLLLERLDHDARGLVQVHFADVRLV